MARPRKYDPHRIARAAERYADACDASMCDDTWALPQVSKFARDQGFKTRQYLYELAKNEKSKGEDELSDAIKKITDAKARMLEIGGLTGKFNATMAIFLLKQLGYSDKPTSDEETEALKAARRLLDSVDSAID